ncbi:MAG: hypothetical protein IJY65_00745 [Clostridia bacterium]|nr:hypothetical protein [Clostridia bacterium]
MKNKYFDLMEAAFSAYTEEHIRRYFEDVRAHGLTEHGFPRLTANIGILISHGRRRDLLPLFSDMMELCCKTIPTVKAANDFSVREIVACLCEVEASGACAEADTARWRSYLAKIEPTSCYSKFAADPSDDVRNWALFTAVSEYYRLCAGLGGSMDFIELQIASQLKFFDENGMYLDKAGTDVHQPIMYDLVSRGLLVLLINAGYRGRYYEELDALLKKSARLTLKMQSSNGEMAFGGRSNQFLHNEAWLATIFEHEAKRYASEGDIHLAAAFKSAAERAISVTEEWLGKKPVRHIKNRFETETKYGCEGYAYFDKYMITVASNLYAAYSVCDDSIPSSAPTDNIAHFQTSEHFHKLFLRCDGYALEFDINADPCYDSCGLGRLHRAGAPSVIAISCPCPKSPKYTVDIDEPFALSMCSAIFADGVWRFAADGKGKYSVTESGGCGNSAFATLTCDFGAGRVSREHYTVSESGVTVSVEGEGEIGYVLPAFSFDGECYSEITLDAHSLTVSYGGFACRYTTDGTVLDLGRTAANRNGHYRAFLATGSGKLKLKIEIIKE